MDDIHSERGFLYILGDRTDNMGNNYYKVLYLNQKASNQEIRQAYKKFALKYHPDKNSNAGSEESQMNFVPAINIIRNGP